ncbi:MAG: hypothetical protein IKN54_00765 [Lachnospiraceae bacterium]|nr:hypothetical protein [Lachnospiraceae bacterium]
MILIDVPQVAYKTWSLKYRIYDKNGNRDYLTEREAEQDLERALSDYKYSVEHDHVR